MVLKPFVRGLADPQRAWLVVAMASTLAGNFALVGSVANLIVAEQARRDRVKIGFLALFLGGGAIDAAVDRFRRVVVVLSRQARGWAFS